ncbi:hypothetical protein [Pseudomonas sp.]|uniref:hypothetical protein n=1 Tax=Pseudomonas sp. TaxID=306 RepID=UPI003C73AAE4
MSGKLRFKALAALLAVLVLTPMAVWLYVKLDLSRNTEPYATTWSDSRSCYINAYIPAYSSLGVPGKLVKLFSSDAFFRVYRKDDVLLKSSEWLLWQREFADTESEQWVNGNAIYPTNDGYEGWTLPECG